MTDQQHQPLAPVELSFDQYYTLFIIDPDADGLLASILTELGVGEWTRCPLCHVMGFGHTRTCRLHWKNRAQDPDYCVLNSDTPPVPCGFCGHASQLYRRHWEGGVEHLIVTCTNDGTKDDVRCPLYEPPDCYIQPTKTEAIRYWNARMAAIPAARTATPSGAPAPALRTGQ